jgi:polysaccharide export outer membrane protein
MVFVIGPAVMAALLTVGVCTELAKGGESPSSGSQSVGSQQENRGGDAVIRSATAPATDKGSATPGKLASSTAGAALDPGFKIGTDDVLAVNVWGEPEVSQTVTVRPDGKISLPLMGEIVASGLTPKQLEFAITYALGNYLSRPEVTVMVHEVKSLRVVVAGQVAKPGSYPLQMSMTVLDAIAEAGGPLDYAKEKSIFVLRTAPDGHALRLKFNYKDVIHGRNLSQNVRLEPHDTVVVP